MAFADTIRNHKVISGVAGVLILLIVGVVSFAVSNKIAPVSSGWWGPVNESSELALQGYDPVAYHIAGKALPGSNAFSLV